MDQESVHENMDVSWAGGATIFEQGQSWMLEYYPLQTAQTTRTSTSNTYGANGMVTSSVMTSTTTNHTHTLILLYKDRRLRYWGMMGDYSKSEDPEILSIAPAIYAQFHKY
jgi:hypothetical protein